MPSTRAVISLSPPGVFFGDQGLADELARLVNERTAEHVRGAPGRFAGLAVLPLPDVDRALAELRYALDDLGLDGVALLSNVGGTYLGDRAWDPLFDELDRRGAYVFLHPTAAPGAPPLPEHPIWLYEFPFDTTRAVANLIYSGTLERCPRIRLQVSHLGGTAPFLAHRLASLEAREPERAARAPAGALAYLRRLYYDTGLSNYELPRPADARARGRRADRVRDRLAVRRPPAPRATRRPAWTGWGPIARAHRRRERRRARPAAGGGARSGRRVAARAADQPESASAASEPGATVAIVVRRRARSCPGSIAGEDELRRLRVVLDESASGEVCVARRRGVEDRPVLGAALVPALGGRGAVGQAVALAVVEQLPDRERHALARPAHETIVERPVRDAHALAVLRAHVVVHLGHEPLELGEVGRREASGR